MIGIQQEASVESGAGVGSPGAEGEEGEKEDLSTKKPDVVVLPEDMTAMQIDCGTFHTGTYIANMYIPALHTVMCVCVSTAILLHSGDVYVFGHNKHGQLGQGNSKDW